MKHTCGDRIVQRTDSAFHQNSARKEKIIKSWLGKDPQVNTDKADFLEPAKCSLCDASIIARWRECVRASFLFFLSKRCHSQEMVPCHPTSQSMKIPWGRLLERFRFSSEHLKTSLGGVGRGPAFYRRLSIWFLHVFFFSPSLEWSKARNSNGEYFVEGKCSNVHSNWAAQGKRRLRNILRK